MSQFTRFLLIAFLLVAAAGEVFFVMQTSSRLNYLENTVSGMSGDVALLVSRDRQLSADIVALKERDSLIEKTAGEYISGFDSKIKIEEDKRAALSAALQKAEAERKLAEAAAAAKSAETVGKLTQDIGALTKQSTDLSAVVDSWQARIVRITCSVSGATRSGSGVIVKLSDSPAGSFSIISNKHVLASADGVRAEKCSAKINYQDKTYLIDTVATDIHLSPGDLDYGWFTVGSPGEGSVLVVTDNKICPATSGKVGDRVVILGYPAIGSQNSVTATDGIISGVENGYLVTSAKVERGNSGGAAVIAKDNCLVGIPTYVTAGGIESLARLLDVRPIVK